ncbi:MAG: LIM domain-containing protein [Candidatus Pacearchaeota archaeon]|jgi:hypothetical protein
MTINLEDFRGPMLGFPLFNYFDFKKAIELSDRDFAELYLKLMEEYRYKDGWWTESKGIPSCSKCNEKISGPKDLRRYCGRSLHPNCFTEEIKIEMKSMNSIMKKYFNRVLKVDFSLLDN